MSQNKRKLLYLCSVDWKTIEGRHQKLFVELDKYYDCTLVDVFKVFRKSNHSATAKDYEGEHHTAWRFPNDLDFAPSNVLTSLSYKLAMGNTDKYDIIWISDPQLIRFVPKSFKGLIIYDCLDNHEKFTRKKTREAIIHNLEAQAVERSNVLFASSKALCDKLRSYYSNENSAKGSDDKDVSVGQKDKVYLARNAWYRDDKPIKSPEVKDRYAAGFIGYLGSWVDQSIMYNSLDKVPNVSYRIIGYGAHAHEDNERFRYVGRVPHEELYDKVKDLDALIMPFYINDVTLMVDPVKMYEYVSFGKCLISIYYPEMEHFKDFVYFYHNEEEYCELMNKLAKEGFPPCYDEQKRDEFLKDNTWEVRGQTIYKAIEDYFG